MITRLEARNPQGAVLGLDLDDVSDGLIVESIEGLDPVKATLVTSSFAQLDGAQYHSSRREPRNIKIRFELESDYGVNSIQEIRRRLYSYFMPKSLVHLRFRRSEGLLDADISGRVESMETALFTQEPAVDVSIMCFDPDFFHPTPIVKNYGTTPSTTDPAGALDFDYEGSVETGFLFTLLVNRATDGFTIFHAPPDGTLRTLDFTNRVEVGDVVKINTSVGEKSAIRTRGGVDSSVLWALSPQSSWLELQPGPNRIRVYAEGTQIPYNIRYIDKYGGL